MYDRKDFSDNEKAIFARDIIANLYGFNKIWACEWLQKEVSCLNIVIFDKANMDFSFESADSLEGTDGNKYFIRGNVEFEEPNKYTAIYYLDLFKELENVPGIAGKLDIKKYVEEYELEENKEDRSHVGRRTIKTYDIVDAKKMTTKEVGTSITQNLTTETYRVSKFKKS